MIPYRDETTPLLLFCFVHGMFAHDIYRSWGSEGRTSRNRRTMYLSACYKVRLEIAPLSRRSGRMASRVLNRIDPWQRNSTKMNRVEVVASMRNNSALCGSVLGRLSPCQLQNRSPLQNVVTSMSGFSVHSKSLGFSVKTFLFYVASCVRGVFHEKRMTEVPCNFVPCTNKVFHSQ